VFFYIFLCYKLLVNTSCMQVNYYLHWFVVVLLVMSVVQL